jgi:hypothetical protein
MYAAAEFSLLVILVQQLMVQQLMAHKDSVV